MPFQNRVTPYGEIVALTGRGLLMGNRGILHDEERRLVRRWQTRRWIACVTSFRGRRRELMRPHSYTELFFLDEATTFAAGHRPCAECRYADYRRFKEAWENAFGEVASADQIDATLHSDRLERDAGCMRKHSYIAEVSTLPDGVYISLDTTPWLLWRGKICAWSAAGYIAWRMLPRGGHAEVLTPRALVAVIRAGYTPMVHPSAENHAITQ